MYRLKKGEFSLFPAKVCENLDTNSQVVLAWLCFFANENGECFPSFKTLAQKCHLSERTIIRATKNLVQLGYIEKETRKYKDSFTSNLYTITLMTESHKGYDTQSVPYDTQSVGVMTESHINQNYINQNNLTEKDIESATEVKTKKDNIPYEKIRELYNTIVAHQTSIAPNCMKITKKRESHIRARWKEDLKTLEEWEKYFKRVVASDFFINKKFLDFGWLINAENCTKILEDKYSNFRNQK